MHPSFTLECVSPSLDAGSHAVKRLLGERVEVGVDLYRQGHDVIAAALLVRPPGETSQWETIPLEAQGNDRWTAGFDLRSLGEYTFKFEAWIERFDTWQRDIERKLAAGQDLESDLIEGRELARAAGATIAAKEGAKLQAALLDPGLAAKLRGRPAEPWRDPRTWRVLCERERAGRGAWYEMFPRSQGTTPGQGATFNDCIARLPEIERMGFDVLYLPPIHPIGHTNRKGANNSLRAKPGEPGSPYAIGSEAGGHDAVEPSLGTLADFDRLVAVARERGLELALDFAINCSPDHPYVRQHPEWFFHRPDGSIKYAENPPKRYEDIYPLDFDGPHARAIWAEMRRVLEFWAGHGVRIFRVDNPHTKPVEFWTWLLTDLRREFPDLIFLSEAFTRPKPMKHLAKIGFSQSYTYFTWRNTKAELTEYLTELALGPCREYFRPNFFVNTPDILPPILQAGGRPAFIGRLVLAATLSPNWGMYNGYELCENRAVPGTEEYQDSEKYQFKVWDWDRAGNIKDVVAAVNRIRREHPALRRIDTLRWLTARHNNMLFYAKATPDHSDVLAIAVNLNPFAVADAPIEIPARELGLDEDQGFEVTDLLTATPRGTWRGRNHMLRLDPEMPAAILRLR